MSFSRFFLLCVLSASSVHAADPFIGTWKFNAAKSKIANPAALEGATENIEEVGPSSYRITQRSPNGRPREVQVRLDGKDYSNDGDGRDFTKDSTAPPGTGMRTMGSQRIDDHHILTIFKLLGKEYQRAERSISQDGKDLTVHQWGKDRNTGQPFDTTTVWDKQ